MEDELGPISIEFLLNNDQLKAKAAETEASLLGIDEQAQKTAAALNATFKTNVIPAATAEVEALNLQFRTGAINLQTYSAELVKLGVETKKVASQPIVNPAAVEESIGLIGVLEERLKLLKTQKIALVDVSQIELANTKIQALEVQLQQMHNVGRTGFDDLWNRIVETEAKTTPFGNALSRVTNLSNIGARAVTQLSRQIIGLGVGLLSFAIGAKAIEWIVDYVKTLDIFTGRLDQAKQNLLALNEVQKNANEDAGKQLVPLQLLYKAATDVTKSMESRIQAAKDLRAQYPEEFANSSNLAIVNGKLKSSYDDLTKSIIENAKAEAAKSKIATLESSILDNQFQIDKNNVAKAKRISQVKPLSESQIQAQDRSGGGAISIKEQIAAITAETNFANKSPSENIKIAQGTVDYLSKLAAGVDKSAKTLGDANKLLGNNIQNFNTLLKNASDKADYENIKKALQAKLDSLAPDDKQIAGIQDKIRKVEELEKAYSPKTTDGQAAAKKADSLAKQQEAAAEALVKNQIELQQKLKEFTNKAGEKQLDPDQSALTQISDQFGNIKFQIEQANARYDAFVKKFHVGAVASFNANPANKVKLTKTDPNTLASQQDAAVTNQANLNENKYIQADIEKKKALYADYTFYKEKLGKEAADKEYEDLLLSGKDLQTYLTNLQKSIPQGDLSGAIVERRKLVTTEQEKDAKAQAGHLTDLAVAYNSYHNRLLLLEETYQANRAKLVQAGNTDAVNELDTSYKFEVENLQASQANKIAQIEHYNANVIELTRQQAKAQIQALKEVQAASPNLTSAQNEDIDAQVGKLKGALGSLNGLSGNYSSQLEHQKSDLIAQLAPLQEGSDKWKEIVKSIALVDEKLQGLKLTEFQKTMGKVADYSDAASQGFSTLASSFTDINPALSDTLATLGEITKTLGDGAKLAGSISEGNVAGIITGVANVASDVIGLFTRGKKSAEEADAALLKYQDDLLKGQIAYNELLREQARSQDDITKLTLTELKARQDMLKTQTTSAQSDYNTLLAKIQSTGQEITGTHEEKYGGIFGAFQKTKTVNDTSGLGSADYEELLKLYTKGELTDSTKSWFEELKKVHDEMGSITDAAKAAADQMAQIATGTTASALSDAIISGLKSGEKSVDDFADYFQESMQKAGLSFFESEVVNKKMAAFYDEFAKAAEGGLTTDKIATLKSSYNTQIADILNQYKELTKIIGDPVLTASSTSVTGITKSITETTGTQIDGHLTGIQLATVSINAQLPSMVKGIQDGLIEMRSQTLLQIKIEANTKRSADSNDKILDNTGKMVASLDKIKGNQGDNLGTLLKAFGK